MLSTLRPSKWEKLPVPLPRLPEQLRITAKMDELMALCSELESGLATTTATRFKLLETSLQEAFIL
jgi:type I restriction enzyme S subunit